MSVFWVSRAGSGYMLVPEMPPCSVVKATKRGKRAGTGSAPCAKRGRASEERNGSPRVKPPAPRRTCRRLIFITYLRLLERPLLEFGPHGHGLEGVGHVPLARQR